MNVSFFPATAMHTFVVEACVICAHNISIISVSDFLLISQKLCETTDVNYRTKCLNRRRTLNAKSWMEDKHKQETLNTMSNCHD